MKLWKLILIGAVLGAALFWFGWCAGRSASPAPALLPTPPRDLLCVAVLDAPWFVQQTVWGADREIALRRPVPMDAPVSALFDY